MEELRERLPEDVIEDVLAAPGVRSDAVARARALLHTPRWCHADEIAAELVDCYVGRRLP
jgi:hypothetical protein